MKPIPQAKLRCTVGLLHWNDLRNEIKRLRWQGHHVEAEESSGWLDREFLIRGDAAAVRHIARLIDRMA